MNVCCLARGQNPGYRSARGIMTEKQRSAYLLFLAVAILVMGCFAPPPRLIATVLGFAAGLVVCYVIERET